MVRYVELPCGMNLLYCTIIACLKKNIFVDFDILNGIIRKRIDKNSA